MTFSGPNYSQVGTASNDKLLSIKNTSDGGYISTGFVDATLPNQTSFGNRDGWIIKYTSTNNIEWSKQYGTKGLDMLFDLVQLSDGSYVAV
ncbi:MAG: hypothetical protein ACRCTA_03895 [Bacilli bacterium]